MSKLKEKEILSKIMNDRTFDEGFRLLVVTYQERIYWHIRRILHVHSDADDVMQNTFIKVFQNIKGFRAESQLYTWIYRIATNEALSLLKKNKTRQSVDLEEQSIDDLAIADNYFDSEGANVLLKKAIEKLPEKQKIIFNLRYYENMAYKDMSEVLDTSVGALKASFHHAVNKVEQYLVDNYDYANG